MIQDGDEAFAALSQTLAGAPADKWSSPAFPAFERLRRALASASGRTAVDLAILIRQALMFEKGRRQGEEVTLFLAACWPLRAFAAWEEIGISALVVNDGLLLEAIAWRPAWLDSPPEDGVDAYAAAEQGRRSGLGSAIAGDPFLASVSRQTYQTLGQRAVVRASLATPPGGSLAVGLATGEGKSLVFQLAQRVGFAGQQPGLIVVVVPTVALAIDHENSAIELGIAAPLAYRGGQHANNAALISKIEEDLQGLCIASPEAVCGPLLAALKRSAERGRLSALVIDEAHLVDGWGTGFRTEFQTLGGVRQDLINLSPPGKAPRTLLLSATLTPATTATLRALFSGPGPFEEISAIRLRAEPDYWFGEQVDQTRREDQVLEALRRVPRPAVLYVTTVKDAKVWASRLRDEGFGNFRVVHGSTPPVEREATLRDWRKGDVDLVVGTSAFGLGIDYRHVRSVLHACIPETLDRFYQEVGRGGRDGRSCLSIVVPANGDLAIAERISQALVISVDRARQRWGAMFDAKFPAGVDTFDLPLDVAPSFEPEDIDMQGERNSDWNARVLTLMARSGLIQMLGSIQTAKGAAERVKIINHDLHQARAWSLAVEPTRAAMIAEANRSLSLMRRFLSSPTCPTFLLRDLYQVGLSAQVCSRCEACRLSPDARQVELPPYEPSSPWPSVGLGPGRLDSLLDPSKRSLVIFYDPAMRASALQRRFGELLESLMREGVRNLVLVGDYPSLLSEAQAVGKAAPLFLAQVSRLAQRRLPSGPELVVVAPGAALSAEDLAARKPGEERVMLVPTSIADPARPASRLQKTYGGRSLSFETAYARIQA